MLPRSTFYPRVFALVVAAILGYALVLIFAPFFGAMCWAAFLAFLLFPLNVRGRERLRGKGFSAGLLTLLAPIVILLPLSALSLEFVRQISALLQKLQAAARQWDIKTFSDLQQFPTIARANDWLQSHTGVSATQVQGWLVSGTQQVLQRAAGFSGTFFLGALDSLVLRLFLIEAVFMGAISSLAGWLLGYLAALLVHAIQGLHDITPAVTGYSFVISLVVGILLTFVAAMLPARRASQMPPAAALRTEV